MAIRLIRYNLIIVIIFAQLFLQVGCKKNCQHNEYVFNASAVISPIDDSIHVGDTILFTCAIPTTLLDEGTNRDIDYSNAENMATDIHIVVPLIANPLPGAVDSFNFIAVAGAVQPHQSIPHSAKTVVFTQISGNYVLTFKMVALKRGIYTIAMIDVQNSKKNCSTAYINVPIRNADKHQQYLQAVYYPGSPFGDTIPTIERTHSYCFKVY